ncbi:unnamed protein product, partial [Meganyctiphanes norvegica]
FILFIMVKNKYRPKNASTKLDASGPKKTPIVSPHEFDGLIGFEEVKDFTLIKGRFGKKTKQVFKDGKLVEKKKRRKNRNRNKKKREKELKDNADVDKETIIESSKENTENASEKDISAKEVITNESKDLKKESLNTKQKKKNKKNKNKKRNISESSVDSATVIEVLTDESITEEETKMVEKSPSEKRKSNDENPLGVTAPTAKKARYNTSVYKGTAEGKKVDVSAWKDIFTPSIVMDALAELGFSQPTEIQ